MTQETNGRTTIWFECQKPTRYRKSTGDKSARCAHEKGQLLFNLIFKYISLRKSNNMLNYSNFLHAGTDFNRRNPRAEKQGWCKLNFIKNINDVLVVEPVFFLLINFLAYT